MNHQWVQAAKTSEVKVTEGQDIGRVVRARMGLAVGPAAVICCRAP